MIEWKKFDSTNAHEEIKEGFILIYCGGNMIYHVQHDASNKWFYVQYEIHMVTYPYSEVTHYAKINFPNDKPDPDEGYIYCPNCGRVKEDL